MKEIFKFDEANCAVCNAGFLKDTLDEQGRCKVCSAHDYPINIKQEQEYIKSPEQQRAELKSLVKECLNEILEEKEQEKKEKAFKPKPCKHCGKEFVPRAPAMRVCDDCQDANRKNK